MNYYKIKDTFDGAEHVWFDDDLAIVYVWHGGNGVNVYSADLREIDYFSYGDGKLQSMDYYGRQDVFKQHSRMIAENA
jgi:hypothetical protein